jgi:ribose 5-phosphate isomerase A
MSDDYKRQAALAALEYVRAGMTVGLGTGSTADHFIHALAERVSQGLDIKGVPTSARSEALAKSLGIALTEIEGANEIDVTIDGADEIDPMLSLIKGAGGALLREKIVAAASREMIVIADDSKCVARLGASPLPIEIVRFGVAATTEHIFWALRAQGISPEWVKLREVSEQNQVPFITDSGNLIIDCACEAIPDAPGLAAALSAIPGVVEHGLFIHLAGIALVAGRDGIQTLYAGRRPRPKSPIAWR